MKSVIFLSIFLNLLLCSYSSFNYSSDIPNSVDNASVLKAYNSINGKSTNFTISYKATIQGINKKINGNFEILNGEIRGNAVVSNLGIEAFKFRIINDSIIYIDRINKQFYSGLISNFKMISNYNYLVSNMSNILLGRLFYSDSLDIVVDKDEDSFSFKQNENKNINISYFQTGLIKKLIYCNASSCYNVNYVSFNKKKLVANAINIELNNKDNIELKYLTIKKCRRFNSSFKIPKSYTEL